MHLCRKKVLLLRKRDISYCFHLFEIHYLYGKKFIAERDHKRLKSIVNTPMHKTPPRIQRFIMFLEKYDSVVNYVPGKVLIWDKVFKNGTNNICGRQPLKYCYTLNTLFHLLRHFKQSTTQRTKPRNIRDRSKLPSLLSHTQLLHQHIKIKIVRSRNDK